MENKERSLDNEQSTQVEDTTENNDTQVEGEDKDAVIAKLKEERDNYKRGLLAAKQKHTLEGVKKEEEKEEAKEFIKPEPKDEDKIVDKALRKMAEKQAISEILDPDSPSHIPECVDSNNWNQIVAYIPSGADRDTAAGVKRALKIAVSAWKMDTGRTDSKSKDDKSADILSVGESSGGEKAKGEKPKSTLNIPKKEGIDTWFPKKGSE
jgi:hypothetical protein